MGLFSSIGDIVKDVVKPVASAVGMFADPISAISSGLGVFNSITGRDQRATNNALNAQIAGQQLTNAQALEEAQRNRDFQERLSSTAHQREIADLRSAGLNPILSATGGNGASSAAGNMASLENPWKDTVREVNAARKIQEVEKQRNLMEMVRLGNETARTESEVSLNKQKEIYTMDAARSARADADLKWGLQGLNIRKGENLVADTDRIRKEIEHLSSQINLNSAAGQKLLSEKLGKEIQNLKDKRTFEETEWGSGWRKFLNPTKAFIDTFNPLQGLMP